MPSGDRPSRGTGRATAAGLSAARPKPSFSKVWPQIWALIKPRRYLLAGSFLLMVVNRGCSLVLPASFRYLIDEVMTPHNLAPLPKIVAIVVLATIMQGITSYSLTQLLSKAGQRLITELRIKVQAHIGKLPVSFFDENRTGTLVARIMTDVEGVRNLIGEVTGRLTESLGGVRVVKGYHAEDSEARVFATGVKRLLANVISSLTAQSLMALASTTVLGVVTALIMFLGGHQVVHNQLTVGQYVSYVLFLAFMVAPIAQLVSIGTQLTEAAAGLDRTNEILNEREEDGDPRRTLNIEHMRGEITFDEVVFEYEEGKPVLHGITFDSQPGTVTALVGSSGSGKSTIISLVCGFHTATGGRILVDGTDLATLRLSSYRQQLGVVLQETFLFDGTIRENVLFSRPLATEEEFLEACRVARVDEFAERFPEQYETIVGERGVKLSGGQRQRISIARAILADPRILILDEATSSLDSESEAMIQSGLNHLMQGRTTFVIAHRLSTIRRADQILVVEKGNIVERGTHESLYQLGGRYFDLYTRQHGLETNLFLAPGEGDKIAEATTP
jgi:ABC-type multidrug transport system fused ATPase/permease subunit